MFLLVAESLAQARVDDSLDAIIGRYFPEGALVFGVPVHISTGVPFAESRHAVHVLAEYLDNDEDGVADDSLLVDTLLQNDARLFITPTRSDLDRIFERLEGEIPGALERSAWYVNAEGITGPLTIWQDLAADEIQIAGAEPKEFDGSLEEIWHLISHVGLANAYPDVFAERPGSRLANAMDAARGGRFPGVPEQYPDTAWYAYDDTTCVYQCQVTEYFYWALTSLLGAQEFPGRFDEIQHEWHLNTAEKLERTDTQVYGLLNDPLYAIPTRLPTGHYKGHTIEFSDTTTSEIDAQRLDE